MLCLPALGARNNADLVGTTPRSQTPDSNSVSSIFYAANCVEETVGVAREYLANGSFVLQRIDDIPRLRADPSIDGNVVLLLQLLDSRLRFIAVASVNTADIKPDEAHPFLRTPYRQAGRAYT